MRRSDNRLAIVANRVKRNTRIYQSLTRFLGKLDIPIVATFRDSQCYIRSAELGVGIHEMKPYLVQEDLEHWQSLLEWLALPPGAAARGAASPIAALPLGAVS